MSQRDSGYQRKERDSKRCDACGSMFYRNPKYGRRQWAEARWCGPSCANKSRATHGMRKTRIYRVWAGIKTRCLNPNDPLYAHYGARGITICDEWANDFAAFMEHMGGDPGPQFQVGRIDNNLGYQPGNVRWETREQNARNKRNTRWVTIGGKEHPLIEVCASLGLPYKRVHARLKAGWSLTEALRP